MKKIIVLLVFGLSMIGCEKEKCEVCTTVNYHQGVPIEIHEAILCGEQLDHWDGKYSSVIDINGNIISFSITTCR